mgnify:CR=1 FL=1|jgi:hypothetical protein
MSSPVPLQSDRHANLKIATSDDYSRYKDQNLVPIVVPDFFTLAAEYPLVFVHNAVSGELAPVAMMGLKEGQNLYCQSKEWPSQLVPLSFNNGPFSIARTDTGDEQFVVLIDEESSLLSEAEGEALFAESGEKSDYLEKKIDAVIQVAQKSINTQGVCKYLSNKGLFSTQQVQLQFRPNTEKYNINGVYTINEEALNALSDADYLELRKKGLLALIYAHLVSLQQLHRILKMQYEVDRDAAAR